MCGRYANHIKERGSWSDILGDWPGSNELGYNVAPTQTVPVLLKNRVTQKIDVKGMRWGLLPSWSREPNTQYATFNARSETMAEKPTFKTAWRQSQTCLLPAIGYYEWKGPKGNKQPYFIKMRSDEPLVMAGLWDYWQKDNQSVFSCTIITHPSQDELIEIHGRMPVLLERFHAEAWLNDGTNRFNLITKQQHVNRLEFFPVSKAVNGSRHDAEELILKAAVS